MWNNHLVIIATYLLSNISIVSVLSVAAVFVVGIVVAPIADAQVSDDVIRIGFITDLSGPYAEVDGPAGGEAIRMAIADMGGTVAGKRVEVLLGDHQNKTDVAAALAREWFDYKGVDVLIGGVNSDTSLAMAKVAHEKKKLFIVVGAGTSVQTNEQCSPYVVQYAYDTTALGKVTGGGVSKAGGNSWYFLTADYEFGSQLEKYTTAAVKSTGGKIVGAVKHPHAAEDFTPFLREAKDSKAQVLALSNGHTDTINAVKRANALGITKSMKLAGLLVFIDEVHKLGLKEAQGLYLADSWYWTRDDETRTWSRRFFQNFERMPSSLHAADYSAARQYLTAVKAIGSTDGDQVISQMRKQKINDIYAKNGYIRADGIMIHDMYLLQVKSPDQSKEPWDYYNLVETFRGESAWTTNSESKCALWK